MKLLKEENEAFTIDGELGIEHSVMEIASSPSKLLNWAQSLSPLPHQVGWSHFTKAGSDSERQSDDQHKEEKDAKVLSQDQVNLWRLRIISSYHI